MKAVILASGEGKRMKPLTDSTPKCLIEVGGKTLLQRQLQILEKNGIKKIVITTGPFESEIISHVNKNFPLLEVEYVNNPDFRDTNYIYSLWLARGKVNDDILLIHSDLIFDESLLRDLLHSHITTGVLVNNEIEPPEKDFKAIIENDMVVKIGVNFFGGNAFFCAPCYKLSRKSAAKWLEKINEYVISGKKKCYAEDALNEIIPSMEIFPVFYGKEFCMEIDDLEDLKKAEEHFKRLK